MLLHKGCVEVLAALLRALDWISSEQMLETADRGWGGEGGWGGQDPGPLLQNGDVESYEESLERVSRKN